MLTTAIIIVILGITSADIYLPSRPSLFLSEDEVLPCEAQKFHIEIGAADVVLLALVPHSWMVFFMANPTWMILACPRFRKPPCEAHKE